ncbi:hypothetical protein LSH36_302g04049 [Paralvinella palmiformis]|uniref:FLYWCH-type domain-containing protein n=1 Tax=Paralvinella palmiformis TaxID=53620 RepID=A0AAD9JIX8_9ANNE|nr:hypothetical protein LSH36_302g04049 [Paralvinella palmiformis]
MEIVRTNKGEDNLCLDGYMYTKKRSYKNWIRWKCRPSSSSQTPVLSSLTLNSQLSKDKVQDGMAYLRDGRVSRLLRFRVCNWKCSVESLHHHYASATFHHGTAYTSGICITSLYRDGIGPATPVRAGIPPSHVGSVGTKL